MTEYHNFLDEYSHENHGLVSADEISIDGLSCEPETKLVELCGIGLDIKVGDIVIYSPVTWQTINEDEDYSLKVAFAQINHIEYDQCGHGDEFKATASVKMMTTMDFLELKFAKTKIVQKFRTDGEIFTCRWDFDESLVYDLECKAILRKRVCMPNATSTLSFEPD